MQYIERLRSNLDLAWLQNEEFKIKSILSDYSDRKYELEKKWLTEWHEYQEILKTTIESEHMLEQIKIYKDEIMRILEASR